MTPDLFQEWSVMSSASDLSSSPEQQEFLDMMLLIDRSLMHSPIHKEFCYGFVSKRHQKNCSTQLDG